jgi:hypothetical protein
MMQITRIGALHDFEGAQDVQGGMPWRRQLSRNFRRVRLDFAALPVHHRKARNEHVWNYY